MPDLDRDSDEIDLGELIGTLIEGRWLIAATAAIALAVGGLYAFTATPIYKADALVQVEEKGKGADPLRELSAMFSGETPAEAEIEILRSRSVVANVVEQLRLDIEIQPKRAPLFGGFLARRHKDETPASPLLWMDSYAWGGEQLSISKLEVPRSYENQPLTLIAGEAGGYRLVDEEGTELLRGETGIESPRGDVNILVETLVARPGTEFSVKKVPFIEAIAAFQQKLVVREKGKQTGVLQLELQGPERKQIRDALDALMAAYVQQNVERKAEEAEKTLSFIQGQLPELKHSLDDAELKLKQYRSTTGKVDLSIEAQAVVDRGAEIEKQITSLELQKSELLQRFTAAHPQVVALLKQLSKLENEKRLLESRAKDLPAAELTSVQLARDVKVANELYVLLLTKAQELGILKSGTIGNVRVIDAAVTQLTPVSPKKINTLAMALLLGFAAGIGLVYARKSLNRGIEDPELLERAVGLPVYASLPHSEKQEAMVKAFERKKAALQPLAVTDPADLAIESLRSLRTSIQFSLAASRNNIVMIGGSRPGVGKSFVSINLAHVLADAGKRVLLVDADLRKGQLHRYFAQDREDGLSELIVGGDFNRLVRKTTSENLDFLAAGAVPPNPSELLSSERFYSAVKAASNTYDLILLDAPPILAVTDAALIARVAGMNLMVALAGAHPVRELSAAVQRMELSGARPNGFVLNNVPLARGNRTFGKHGHHYQYDYR